MGSLLYHAAFAISRHVTAFLEMLINLFIHLQMLNQAWVLANIPASQEYPLPRVASLFSLMLLLCLNLFLMFLVSKCFIICSSVLHKHWKSIFNNLLSISKSKHLWFTSEKPGQHLSLEFNKWAFVLADLNISYKLS